MNDTSTEETLLEFPCDFPIKVMGKATDDFDSIMVQIIRKHVDDIREGAIKTRMSRDNNFMSVTVTITATSKQQLDNIYIELNSHELVKMTL